MALCAAARGAWPPKLLLRYIESDHDGDVEMKKFLLFALTFCSALLRVFAGDSAPKFTEQSESFRLGYVGVIEYTAPQSAKQLASISFECKGGKLSFARIDCGVCKFKGALKRSYTPLSLDDTSASDVFPSAIKKVESQDFRELSSTESVMTFKLEDFEFSLNFKRGFLSGKISSADGAVLGSLNMIQLVPDSELLETIDIATYLESYLNQKEYLETMAVEEIIDPKNVLHDRNVNEFKFSYAKAIILNVDEGGNILFAIVYVGECKGLPVAFYKTFTHGGRQEFLMASFPKDLDSLRSASDFAIGQIESAIKEIREHGRGDESSGKSL